jgi:alpha-L-fucosidase
MGDWLKVNGEAIYETEAYSQSYQWSPGIQRKKNDASFMAGYSISKMVVPVKDTASIECFFTRKNKDLYCIIPSYRSGFTVKNLTLPATAGLTVLGSDKKIPWKQQGKNVMIDLSALRPGDIAEKGIFVIKLKNAL